MNWVNLNPNISSLVWHTPNGGKRNIREAIAFKRMGVKSGVPDIQVAIPSNGCHGLFIEFKSKGGSVTQIQKNMHDKLKDAGYRVEVVYDWFEARIILSEYIRGTKYDRPSAIKGMYNKTGSCGS